jgi:hypothetical protein
MFAKPLQKRLKYFTPHRIVGRLRRPFDRLGGGVAHGNPPRTPANLVPLRFWLETDLYS